MADEELEVPGIPGRRRTPTDEITKARRRALAKLVAYVVVAIPGAYSAVRTQTQADQSTLAAVNREKADQIVVLQEWAKADKAEIQATRKELQDLRAELARDRRDLTTLLVRLARDGGRYRHLRAPEPDAPAPPSNLPAREVKLQEDLNRLAKAPPKPEPPPPAPRPALKKPASTLEQIKAAY